MGYRHRIAPYTITERPPDPPPMRLGTVDMVGRSYPPDPAYCRSHVPRPPLPAMREVRDPWDGFGEGFLFALGACIAVAIAAGAWRLAFALLP